MKMFAIVVTLFLSALSASASGISDQAILNYLDDKALSGDVVFQVSQSRQSAVLEEAMETQWTHMGILFKEKGAWVVYETAAQVQATPFITFAKRGRDQRIVLKRVQSTKNDLSTAQGKATLREALREPLGRQYDILFQWSEEALYCSEYVHKVYREAFGAELGELEKFADFRLDGPLVQKEIKRRYSDRNIEFRTDEVVISPLSIFEDPKLSLVFDSLEVLKNRRK